MGFCSGDLMEEIKGLVHRHPDKLTVCSLIYMNYISSKSLITMIESNSDCSYVKTVGNG